MFAQLKRTLNRVLSENRYGAAFCSCHLQVSLDCPTLRMSYIRLFAYIFRISWF